MPSWTATLAAGALLVSGSVAATAVAVERTSGVKACVTKSGVLRLRTPAGCPKGTTATRLGVEGPRGARGPKGASAAVGTAVVNPVAHTVLFTSGGIKQVDVEFATGNDGVVCFSDLPFTPHGIAVTGEAEYGVAADNQIDAAGSTEGAITPAGCTSTPEAIATAYNAFTGQAPSVMYISFF